MQDGLLDASGYDANVYCEMDFFGEWETRSYMASIVANRLDKIINVPTLKDHSASGVTGCLKNVAYGTFNNVARSHKEPYSFTNPLIGVMCTVEPLRSKVVLNIMDGMRMVWHGGPLTQNQEFISQTGVLMMSTDPVAMDTIELEAIDKKRLDEGAPSVWEHDPKSLTKDSREFYEDASKNLFYRQPGHIAAAGKLGLGVSDLKQIDHRKLQISCPMTDKSLVPEVPASAENDWVTLLKDNARTGGRAPRHCHLPARRGGKRAGSPDSHVAGAAGRDAVRDGGEESCTQFRRTRAGAMEIQGRRANSFHTVAERQRCCLGAMTAKCTR